MSLNVSKVDPIPTWQSLHSSMVAQLQRLITLNAVLANKQSCLAGSVVDPPNSGELQHLASMARQFICQSKILSEQLNCTVELTEWSLLTGPKPATNSPGSQADSNANGDR